MGFDSVYDFQFENGRGVIQFCTLISKENCTKDLELLIERGVAN